MTKIKCANGGAVELDDSRSRVELTWYLNDEDGLGQVVDPHLMPASMIKALGTTGTGVLIHELLHHGIGATVDVPQDVVQRASFARQWDAAGWRDVS